MHHLLSTLSPTGTLHTSWLQAQGQAVALEPTLWCSLPAVPRAPSTASSARPLTSTPASRADPASPALLHLPSHSGRLFFFLIIGCVGSSLLHAGFL